MKMEYRMKKYRFVSLLLILCLILPLAAVPAAATDGVAASPLTEDIPYEGFAVNAKAAALIDLSNGRSIYELNIDERIYPASLTKIMTCLLALENGNLSDIVTVTESAFTGLDGSSSSSGLKVGEQLTLENALYCLMLASGNEAANLIAEHIAGSISDFVRMMNERAYTLGCTGTHFANPHGLHDEEHYTTVRDLVTITQAALKSETFKIITNTATYTLPATNMSEERTLETTNQLINNTTSNPFYYSKAIGIKTGYTTPAGRCVISTAKSNGMYFLAVVCGAATTLLDSGEIQMESFPECIRLFRYGFENYAYVTAISPLYPVAQIRVNNSAASEVVSLAPVADIKLLLPKTYDPSLLTVEPQLSADAAEAPVSAGDVFGTVSVYYDGELLGTTNLTAINDVARSEISAAATQTGSYIQRSWWKWVVIAIAVVLAAIVILLVYAAIRRRAELRRRMAARRKALEKRRRFRDEFDNDDFMN